MPILFAVVARGVSLLAKYANCAGNFTDVCELVLAKITPDNEKKICDLGDYLAFYIVDDRIVYLCITDNDYDRSKAFAYLTEIKRDFQNQYGARSHTALPYSMNSEFSVVLQNQMRRFNNPGQDDKITNLKNEVGDLKDVMVRNIDQMVERGERMELLVDRSENLNAHSITFRTTSRNLARTMWWKNMRLTIIIIVVILVLIFIIVTASCGGLDYHRCTSNN